MNTTGVLSDRSTSTRVGSSAGLCLMAVAVLLGAARTAEGGIAQGRKLLADKKYADVDRALGRELRDKKPSPEALRISLDAAMASGRFVTAQRRVTALLKATGKGDLDMVFTGAQVAALACEDSIALSRYVDYAQRQTARSDKLRYALGYLGAHGKFPQLYKKYLRLWGADDVSWSMGIDLLGRLISDGEVNQTFDVAQTLLESFTTPARVRQVHLRLLYAAENGRLGSDDQNVYVLPMRIIARTVPSNYDPYIRLLGRAATKISKDDLLSIVFTHQHLAKKPLPSGLFGHFNQIGSLGSDEKKLVAGRKFLALEPIYRDAKDPLAYAAFGDLIKNHTGVFKIKGRELVTEDAADRLIDSVAGKAKASGNLKRLLVDLADRYLSGSRRAASMRKHAVLLPAGHIGKILPAVSAGADRDKQIAEGKRAISVFLAGRSFAESVDARASLMAWYNTVGDKAALLAAARDYMDLYPVSFKADSIHKHVLQSKLPSIDEKVALVRAQLVRAGPGGPNTAMAQIVNRFIKRLSRKEPKYQAIVDLFNAGKPGTEVLLRYASHPPFKPKRDSKRAAATAAQFLKEYTKALPLGPRACKGRDDVLALRILTDCYNNAHGRQEAGQGQIARAWLARASGPGAKLAELAKNLTAEEAAKVMSRLGGGIPPGDPMWAKLADIQFSGAAEAAPLAKFYQKMGWNNALHHVARQMGYPSRRQGLWWDKPAVFAREVSRLVASGGFKATDPSVLAYVILCLGDPRGKVAIDEKTVVVLWRNYAAVSGAADLAADLRVRVDVLRALVRSGQDGAIDANLRELLSRLGKLPVTTQAAYLEDLCASLGLNGERNREKAGPYARMVEKLADLYSRMSDADWAVHRVKGRLIQDISALTKKGSRRGGEFSRDGRLFKAVDRITPILMDQLARGARATDRGAVGRLVIHSRLDLDQAIDRGDWRRVVHAANLYFRAMPQSRNDWDSAYREDIIALAKTLEKAKAWEVLYIVLERMRRAGPRESVAKALARYRTQAANNIRGLVAVSKGDKTYPLHLAAQLLSLGDEARAWQLTRTRTKLLTEEWTSFEPKYVAWCIEQMRKNKMTAEGLRLAFTALLKENDMEPEVAGRILLARGDIYRDKKNYDVAKIEYRALRDNPRYRQTGPGTEATYHLVSLMIDTGQYTTARRLIERLIDSVDLTVKAEGYYLMARLAYEQKDYETAATNIDKVRLCVNDHVEAAFLDGLLKLKLPGGMINPEVEIGTAATRRILIPGEELSLKLQDADLSIARDQKTIPILVQSTSGKDKEVVDLISLAGGKNLFTGTLRTMLGQAKPNSGVLEVTGADRVSYVIAPDFQRKNKIDYPAKYLDIRTTGQLAASAAEILTPQEIEKQRLAAGLAEAATPQAKAAWQRSAGNMVRPGNDIYFQVHDIDQDVTGGKDTVSVKLTTTNGDVIESLKLTETAPHSAIFRGTVKTDIPLPKALASDTFEGKSPSSMINSTRPGVWSSLADGEKPKWAGVDMMSSCEMKTITAELPDATRIKSVRLLARLAKDFRQIAGFPVVGVQRGLRAEYFADKAMTKLVAERTVTAFQAGPGEGVAAVRYSGVFVAAASGQHTFTVKTNGAVSLSVAGKEIITGKPAAGKEATYTGQAALKVDDSAIAGRGEVPFKLVYLPAGQAGNTLSVAWSVGGKAPVGLNPSAMYPGGEAQRRDDVTVRYAGLSDGKGDGADPDTIAEYFAKLGRKGTIYRDALSYTAPPADWGILEMSGHFYVPKARYMTLRVTGRSFENAGTWAAMFVDGKEVLARARREGKVKAGQPSPACTVKLTKGVHHLRVAMRGQGVCDVAVQYLSDSREFEPVPGTWFSADHHPALAAAVSPAGHIGVKGNRLVCELTAPARLRAVRWVFDDYEGNAVSVKEIRITDSAGKALVPVKADFTSATTNGVLEIAPGDRVTALYIDEKRPEGGSPDRRAALSTGYYNGSIVIANEVIVKTDAGMKTTYYPARRCGIGDALAILVDEADKDVSPKRDVMEVFAQTSGGQRLTLKALETPGEVRKDAAGKEVEAHHTGKFVALLRLGKEAGKGTIKVAPGDRITVSYMDRENSDPGVAIHRRYELFEGGDPLVEQINFERYTSELVRTEVEDDPDSILRTRAENHAPGYIYKRVLRAAEALRAGAKSDEPLVTSIRTPVEFSIMYPAMAKNTASTIDATAWAESEIQAAKIAKREPRILKIKMACGSTGLDEGAFSGTIGLLVGVPGQDPGLKGDQALAILDTRGKKAPTEADKAAQVMVVVPGDTVHVSYKDPVSGKEISNKVKLLSEGGLEVVDAKMHLELEQIRMGEKFYIRVDDTDRDATPQRDSIKVKITSECGDTVERTLNETLGRSGVFTGWVEPKFVGDKVGGKVPQPNKTDDALSAFFGDQISFEYVDPSGVNSAVPVTHTRQGRIRRGSAAQADLFSKRFKDSEMAVKTSFLMAEALFELAKQRRKLNKLDAADKLIQQGKELLEMTIRDYPDTKLKTQSKFLLANLSQELGKHDEAIAKYAQVISMAPQSDYAARSQFKTAQCYAALKKDEQACDEYVKVTYVYPNSPLAPKATIRMGTYYLQIGQRLKKDEEKLVEAMKNFRIASQIFYKFTQRYSAHAQAAQALFLSGQCSMEMKDFAVAAVTLKKVVDDFPTNKSVRAEAMYWCAESLYNIRDYKGAYKMWTELIWAYPEVQRAKEARGRLASDKRMLKIAEQM